MVEATKSDRMVSELVYETIVIPAQAGIQL